MNTFSFKRSRPSGFTVLELVVAMAIVLILVTVAMVSVQDHLARKARAQAQAALLEAAAGLRFQHARSGSFAHSGLSITQVPSSGDPVYRISLAPAEVLADAPKVTFPGSSDQTFTLRAEPVEVDDCGTLLLDQDGRFGVVGAKARLSECLVR